MQERSTDFKKVQHNKSLLISPNDDHTSTSTNIHMTDTHMHKLQKI